MTDVSSGTNPTIFLRLNAADPQPREMAWAEFHARYAPIVASFARRMGASAGDVDDVVQDVMVGFFARSPSFVYDPKQGRFRGYLKVCACRAVQKQRSKAKQDRSQGAPRGVSIDAVDPDAVAVEQVWADVWEQQRLRRALEELRTALSDGRTFAAFEQYVIQGQPADEVAAKLGLHVNSVYRAKEQVTGMLQQKLDASRDED